jgi:putative ABC transport system permease protein
MSAVRLLNLRHLLRQPLRTALALVAVAAGTALATAVLVTEHSFSTSVERFTRGLGGPAPLRVVGASTRGGLDERTVAEARAVPGVAAAVPVVQAVTFAERQDGTKLIVAALGVDCSVQALVGDVGCTSTSLSGNALLTSPTLMRMLGPGASLRHDLGRTPLTAAIPVPALDRLNGGRIVVTSLPEAQRLFARSGQVDVAFIVPAPHTSLAALRVRLSRAIGSWNAVLAAGDPPPGSGEALFLIPELAMVGLLALAVGALLVFNLISLALAERRRDLAIAGALGASGRLVMAGAVIEAATLGLAGGVAGIAGGIALAHPLVGALSSSYGLLAGIHIRVYFGPWIAVASAAIGTAVGGAAGIVPARRATRTELAPELQQRGSVTESSAPTRPATLSGLAVCSGAGIALAWIAHRHGATSRWQPPTGLVGTLVASVASFALISALTPHVIAFLRLRTVERSGPLPIAFSNLLRESRRTSVLALAVAIAVGMSTLLASSIPSIHAASTRYAGRAVAGGVSVSTLAAINTGAIDAKPSPQLEAALRRIPGVARIEREAFLQVGHSAAHLTAIDANDENNFAFPVFEGHAGQAELARNSVLIGPGLARDFGLHAGSIMRLDTPTGPVSLPVAGVWEDPDNLGHGVTMSLSLMDKLFGVQPPTHLLVVPTPGTSIPALAARISAAHLDPDLEVLTPDQFVERTSRAITGQLAPFWAMQRSLLLVAFIATLSTLLLVGLQRRRELGTLAALGMSPDDLARLTLVEAGTIAIVASALAIVLTLVPLRAFLWSALWFTGSDAPFRYSIGPAAAYAAVAAAVVLAGAAWPAWKTSRLQVIEALRWE